MKAVDHLSDASIAATGAFVQHSSFIELTASPSAPFFARETERSGLPSRHQDGEPALLDPLPLILCRTTTGSDTGPRFAIPPAATRELQPCGLGASVPSLDRVARA